MIEEVVWLAGEFQNDLYHGRGTLTLSEHRVAGRLVVGWRYQGEFRGGRREGHGLLIDGEGGVYEGSFLSDRFDGKGVLRTPILIYEGEFRLGMRHGAGKLQFIGGGIYTGQFYRNSYHGEGEMRYKRGGFYRGSWRMSRRHGVGRRLWVSGAEYEGEWKEDCMNGRGVYRSAAGDTYVGELMDDHFHGDGTLQLAHGDRFTGQFQRGQFCGRGRYEFAGGGYYEGEYWALLRTGIKWRKDERDEAEEAEAGARGGAGGIRWAAGKGRVTGLKRQAQLVRERKEAAQRAYDVHHPMSKEERLRLMLNNRKYGRMLVGSPFDDPSAGGILAPAADGKRHGRGVRVWASGARYEGDWFQDEMTGFGVFVGAGAAGERFEGQFLEGRREGRGVCSWGHSAGDRFVCPLRRSHLGSVGRCIYDGEWHLDRPHGQGKFMCCDGRSYTGSFVNGKRHGFGIEVVMTQRQKEVELRRRGTIAMATVTERYEGHYSMNVKEGRGAIRTAAGDVLRGTFVNGKLHGHVVHSFPTCVGVLSYSDSVCDSRG